jgi:hypothetical protein
MEVIEVDGVRYTPNGARYCNATTAAGKPCTSYVVRDSELCAAHAGLSFGGDPLAANRAGNAALRRKRERARQEEEYRRKGFGAALRARMVEERAAFLDALLAPVLDTSLSATTRQRAALECWTRAFGRPGVAPDVPEGAEVQELTLAELERAWIELDTQEPRDTA